MKTKLKLLSTTSIILAGLALSLGVIGIGNKSKVETKAYYSPSTHYEVSDTASELASYYSSISDSDTGSSLLSKLQSLNSTKRKRTMGYSTIGTDTSGAVIYTDYDLNSTAKDSNGQTYGTKVASFYTKTAATGWNREHMWPNSHGGNNVEADILHTRPTISSENSSRGNSFYVEGKNSSSAGWDPYTAGYDAEVRGECARVILYCVVAYPNFTLSDADSHSTSNSNKDNMMGNMNTLIKWHFDYAPNVYEMNRNNGAEYLQGNRNPFVDHPEYVAKIWSSFNSTVSTLCTNNASKYSSWTPGNYCNYGSNTPVTPNVGVTISNSTASISVGSTTTLSATSTNGGTISWTTSNSSIASISSSTSSSGSNITITGQGAGTATITAKQTISGTQYSATCTVTVTKVVSSLSKGSTSPTKTTYTAGESFNPSGLTITATYTDSTSSNVTSSVVWSPDPLTAGTTSVTGTYGGKTITITGITVNQSTEPYSILPSDLTNGSYPTTATSYTAASGISVTAYNTANFSSKIQFKKSGGYLSSNDSLNLGTLTLSGLSGTVTVYAGTSKNPSSTTISGSNGVYDLSGYNYFKIINNSGSVATCNSISVGLSASTKTLSSISVYESPDKLSYTAGEYFDPTGLEITRTYSDGTEDNYSYDSHSSEFTFTPSTSTALTTSNSSITITYGGKSCTQGITVIASQKTLSSISISGQTTSFVLDDSFVFGGTVTATYSDNSQANVTSSATFSGYNMSVAGNYTVTVSYTYNGTTKTTTYQITVNTSGGGSSTETGEFSETYSYSDMSNWSVSNQGNASGYILCPDSNSSYSVALIPGIFEDKTITSNVVITINSATYGSGSSPTSDSYAVYNSEACTSQVSATQTGTLPTSSAYTDVIYTVSLANASSFIDDLAIKITKPGRQIRLKSITVEFSYEVSGSSSDPITSITATPKKTFYVGETITASDITVKGQSNQNVTGFSFTPHTFTYSEAASGGALTNVLLSASYEALNANFYAQVQRKAYEAPTSTSSLEHTGTEFGNSGIGTSFATGQTATVDGITFSVDGYVFQSSKLSLSDSKTSATGKVINTTPYPTGITNVSVSGATPDIQLSVDGSNWVNLASAQTSATNYYYLKLYYSNTTQSNYVNITSFTVTMKAGETPENVANYIMYEDTSNQCVSKLPTALGYFKNLSSSDKTTFQTSSDYVISTARQRLEAWASSQGKSIDYSTGDLANKNNVISILNNGESANILIIAISVASIGSIGILLYIKKRKMTH